MTVSIDLTETLIMGALRLILLSLMPSGIEIIRGEVNRVPEPSGDDFLIMTPTTRTRLSGNWSHWHDGSFDAPQTPGVRTDVQPTQVTIQIDIHGPRRADHTQILSTLCRSAMMCEGFDATGLPLQVLYAGDPAQAPFINAEQQYEWRWTIDVVLQANPTITTAQDFAAALHVDLHDIL